MNYYKRHLGDYAKNTRTLNTYEHGVYNLVLDLYYTDEGPVSSDDAYAICQARTADEIASVDKVLRKFFVRDGDSWRHERADEEIANYQEKASKNKAIGSLGGKQKAKRKPSKSASGSVSEMPSETVSETLEDPLANGNPSHKPLAISQEEASASADSSSAPPPTPITAAKRKTTLPADFGVSDRVKVWAKKEGFDRLEDHCEAFKRKASAKGYRYVDWDAAFMEAIREDWAKLRAGRPESPAAQSSAALPEWK